MNKLYFGAGQPFDACGNPTSYWRGFISFEYEGSVYEDSVYKIYTEQTLGTGSVCNTWGGEYRDYTPDETLQRFEELEERYKDIYES